MLDLLANDPLPQQSARLGSEQPAGIDSTPNGSYQEDFSTFPDSSSPPASYSTEDVVQSSDDDLDDILLDDVLEQESRNAEAIPGFFNSRVQAGLAAPKRKLTTRDSSESLESHDSEDGPKRRKMNLSGLGDVELLLLRKPPPWSIVERIVAAKRKAATLTNVKVHSQDGTGKPEVPVAQLAKKRKVSSDGALAAWNLIKASSSKKSTPPSSSSGSPLTVPPRATNASQASQVRSPAVPQPSQGQDKPVRRTTLGRAPRAAGTSLWKSK
jgi:hypothetical protein